MVVRPGSSAQVDPRECRREGTSQDAAALRLAAAPTGEQVTEVAGAHSFESEAEAVLALVSDTPFVIGHLDEGTPVQLDEGTPVHLDEATPLHVDEEARPGAPCAPQGEATSATLRALLTNLAHPPLHDRRFWYSQSLVLGVIGVQALADLAQNARLIPVPGFVWYLLIFLPVIYAGTAFGLVGALATSLEATAAAMPNELFVTHAPLARWAGLATLVMVNVCAVHLGDRYERSRREMERRLAEERSRIAAYVDGHPLSWRRLVGMIPDGIALADQAGVIRFVNGQLEMLADRTRSDLVGKSLWPLLPGVATTGAAITSTESREQASWNGALLRGDGEEIPVEVLLRPIQLDGSPWLFVDVRDDRPRRAAEQALAASEQRFRVIYESTMSGIVLADLDDRILGANRAFCELIGYGEEELVGGTAAAFTIPEDRRKGEEAHARLLAGDLPQAIYTKRYRHKDGHLVWVTVQKSVAREESGAIAYFVCSIHDVTNQHRLTSELNHQARHDPLTGLANRRLFEEELAGLLGAPCEGSLLAVLLLDLDNFKRVNDTLGHRAGDELLIAVAGRLQGAVRSTDTLSRFGGDEFLCLASGLDSPAAGERLAARLLAAFDDPFRVAGHVLEQRASVGVAVLDPALVRAGTSSESAEAVLRNADIALYEAKRHRKGRAVLFTGTMREEVANHFELDQALGRALERGEISMHYQPIVELRSGRTAGFEALMRWERRWRGAVPPSTFIALAERNGHILELGRFALEAATKEASGWPSIGPEGSPLCVAVNVSPRQLFAPGFTAEVAELLAGSGLPPARLVIEVTESTLLRNAEVAPIVLEDLRARGVRVAMDDFGTGHSSLSRLAQFRPSILKIDRSFVSPEHPRASTDMMLETIMTLGRRLDMVVIAEGITTAAQREHLVELGCELGQGYLFSPARPAGALATWLRADQTAGCLRAPAPNGDTPRMGVR